MLFEVEQEDKYPEDITSNTRELLMSDNWDYYILLIKGVLSFPEPYL